MSMACCISNSLGLCVQAYTLYLLSKLYQQRFTSDTFETDSLQLKEHSTGLY